MARAATLSEGSHRKHSVADNEYHQDTEAPAIRHSCDGATGPSSMHGRMFAMATPIHRVQVFSNCSETVNPWIGLWH
jgi:hypothetical protein